MTLLAFRTPPASPRRMASDDTLSPERAEQKLTGRVLARLRESRPDRMPQASVAEQLGISTQAYQKYEAGERRFTRDKLEQILRAIGATAEEFEFERQRQLGRGGGSGAAPARGFSQVREREPAAFEIPVWSRAQAGERGVAAVSSDTPTRTLNMAAALGPDADAMEIAGDSMIPWGEPGEVVIFNRGRYPKRGTGCVVETTSGELLVKLYEKSDGSTLFLRQLNPDQIINLPLAEVKGVYAVRFRGD